LRVSESPQSTSPQDAPAVTGDGEVLDALPVLVGQAHAVPAQPAPDALPGERRSAGVVLPAVQAAAVAAGGFVAGAAVVGLVHRRQQRSSTLAKGARAGRIGARSQSRLGNRSRPPAAELVQIVGSRSLLVDVHLLGGSGDR
jgi:hypothetical protein